MTLNVRVLMLCIVLMVIPSASAEVFKCVDDRGRPSYQDTSCPAGKTDAIISLDFANRLDMEIPTADRKEIERINKARRESRESLVRERNARINERLYQLRRKQAKCNTLKADYEEMHIRHRRYGRSDPDAESDLIRRMHEACSG